MSRRQPIDFNLWLMLGAGIYVLAWLLPDKGGPWRSFFNEWMAAAAFLPLALWVGLRANNEARQMPAAALGAMAIASVPILQALAGQIQFRGDAILAVLYASGMCFAIVIGQTWRKKKPASVCTGLQLTAVCAALISVLLATMQWLQVDSLGTMLVALPPNARPTGNIGQSNHLSTLMAWGLVALWWRFESGGVSKLVALALALCLLLGVALSQSRTGWIQLAILATAAFTLRARLRLRISPVATILLLAAFAAAVLGWERVNATLQMAASLTFEQQTSSGPRLHIWQQFVTAILAAPFFGYGWTQGGLAQQAALLITPPLHIVASQAHNLVLDLCAWQGIPLTILMLAGATHWIWHRVSRIESVDTAMCALALLLLLGHSLLEYPYQYTYFILPAALLVGVIEADTAPTARWHIPQSVWLLVVSGMAGMMIWIGGEYLTAKESLERYRFETARVGNTRASTAPDAFVLTQLSSLMVFVRIPPDSKLNKGQLMEAERVVARFPSGSNQFRLASLLAHNSEPKKAAAMLSQLCAMQRAPHCELAVAAWRTLATTSSAMSTVALPGAAKPER